MIDFLLHIDKYLSTLIDSYHGYTYFILFGLIFVETGVVIMPFIPGDSLLFASGALIAGGQTGLNIYLLAILLIFAAFTGDVVNYFVGRYLGPKVFKPDNKILKLEYYEKAEVFFVRHGGKSIALGRFVPLVRTFVPFVAGVSQMHKLKFMAYNLSGGSVWIIVFLALGYFFGNIPVVKNNFSIFVIGVVLLSIMPVFITAFRKSNGPKG